MNSLRITLGIALGLVALICTRVVTAGGADVIDAIVKCENNFCIFNVTVAHEDEGWQHFANAIEVLNAEQDEILGFRVLRHPHVGQKSFTRPVTVLFEILPEKVYLRAHDSIHGYDGKVYELTMPK